LAGVLGGCQDFGAKEMSPCLILFACLFLGAYLGLVWSLPLAACVVCTCLLLALTLWVTTPVARMAGVCLFATCLSITNATWHRTTHQKTVDTLPESRSVFRAIVQDVLPSSSGGIYLKATISGAAQDHFWVPTKAQITLSLRKAAAAIPVETGDEILFRGHIKKLQPADMPGDFDASLFGLSRDLHGRMSLWTDASILISKKHAESHLFSSWRSELRSRLLQLLTPREAGIVLALLIGDTAFFDAAQLEMYRQVGAGHLLAVSGLQVTMIMMLVHTVLTWLWLLIFGTRAVAPGRWTVCVMTLVIVWGFVGLCGWPPSCVRAALMTSTILMIQASNGLTKLTDVFGFSGCVTLLYSPLTVLDPSFLLSYAAILGLMSASRSRAQMTARTPVFGPLTRVRQYGGRLLLASLGAGVLTLPISSHLFGEIAPGGIIANIILVPAAAFLQVPAIFLGLWGAMMRSIFFAKGGAFFGGLLEALCEGLGEYVGGVWLVEPVSFIAAMGFCAAAVMLVCGMARRQIGLFIFGPVFAMIVFGWHTYEPDGVSISVLPVGQGDSSVFELPNDDVILIDGGGQWDEQWDPGENLIVPFLLRKSIKRIRLVVLSHPDPDHLLGLLAVVDKIQVDELWHSGFTRAHPLMRRLLDKATAKGIRIRSGSAIWGEHYFGDVRVQVLAPIPEDRMPLYSELTANDNSLVIHFSFGKDSALWTGDIEEWGENYLLRNEPQILRANILKAPHHGSRTSSQPAFIRQVDPEHVIFTTGRENIFGFPHPEIWTRYQGAGAKLWDTAQHGKMVFHMTGHGIEVNSRF
jgi:competence protein ComEC